MYNKVIWINVLNFPINCNNRAYNFKKANYAELHNSFLYTDWQFLATFNDVNSACDAFYVRLYEIFDQYIQNLKENIPLGILARLYYVIYNIKLKA